MIIKNAEFIKSSTELSQCPEPDKPDYAFLGRSNVGKSSLINMLARRSKLARISGTPGKTQIINHFLINNEWYLTDLPGYGYAKVSKKMRYEWKKMIEKYILGRENLMCLFLLVDSRHNPIESDIEFINYLGTNNIPLARVFTKADKQKTDALTNVIKAHENRLHETWESLPPAFVTSATTGTGREELLEYIENTLLNFENS
ncbi:MAG: ribosome biogenesis GTP-binding protein YihA/YsxC [Bacteroidales bacterium]|nr:ribosome biogenesis GTP-binding protein YihA/YsxC [Bacteroidales bacterium]